MTKAGLQSFPTASLAAQLAGANGAGATNDRFSSTESASDAAVMAAVRQGIQHVIFIIKENRTYDQVLGDLPVGNGDTSLVQWGKAIHAESARPGANLRHAGQHHGQLRGQQ